MKEIDMEMKEKKEEEKEKNGMNPKKTLLMER